LPPGTSRRSTAAGGEAGAALAAEAEEAACRADEAGPVDAGAPEDEDAVGAADEEHPNAAQATSVRVRARTPSE
jgi:hypothetical protein